MDFVNWAMTDEWLFSQPPPWDPLGITPWIAFEDAKLGATNERPPVPGRPFEKTLREPPKTCEEVNALLDRFEQWWLQPDTGAFRWVKAHDAVHPEPNPTLAPFPPNLNQQLLGAWVMGKPPYQDQGLRQWILAHAAHGGPTPENDPPPPPDPWE
jgi:hypothetical protein